MSWRVVTLPSYHSLRQSTVVFVENILIEIVYFSINKYKFEFHIFPLAAELFKVHISDLNSRWHFVAAREY